MFYICRSNDGFDNNDDSCNEQSDGSSADNDEELDDEKTSDHSSLDMSTKFSAHELLEEQRRLPTDVSRKLEKRWMESHFQKQPQSPIAEASRRKMKCSDDKSLSSSTTTHNDDVGAFYCVFICQLSLTNNC